MNHTEKVKFTIFNRVTDASTNKQMQLDWIDFVRMLENLSQIPAEKTGPNAAKLFSPAFYAPGSRRRNADVLGWSWACLDIDDLGDTSPKEILDMFDEYEYVLYSTASCTAENIKFRVIFPLTCEVPANKIKAFWFAINKKFKGIPDAQTKDLSRMYFMPAKYKNAAHFFVKHPGKSLDPWQLMREYPYTPPSTKSSVFDKLSETMQRQMLDKYRASLDKRYEWNSYLDCPFVNKNRLASYTALSGSGWYHEFYSLMVSIAGNAIRRGYPITVNELVQLMREIDLATGNWYADRPIEVEAQRAIDFVLRNSALDSSTASPNFFS